MTLENLPEIIDATIHRGIASKIRICGENGKVYHFVKKYNRKTKEAEMYKPVGSRRILCEYGSPVTYTEVLSDSYIEFIN